jgi:hypothetical protein
MAKQVVQMDYTVIGAVAAGFTAAQAQVTAIWVATVAIITVLLANPFVSLTVGPQLIRIRDAVKQQGQELAQMCGEFSDDLKRAIGDHRTGDYGGKRYFGEGVR